MLWSTKQMFYSISSNSVGIEHLETDMVMACKFKLCSTITTTSTYLKILNTKLLSRKVTYHFSDLPKTQIVPL